MCKPKWIDFIEAIYLDELIAGSFDTCRVIII